LNVDDRVLAPTTAVADNPGVDLQSILARVTYKFGGRPALVPAK
jgi:hypothetical protein